MKRGAAIGILTLSVLALAVAPALAAGAVVVEDVDLTAHPQVSLTISLPPELVGTSLPDDAFSIVEGEASVVPNVERLDNEDLEVVLVLDT